MQDDTKRKYLIELNCLLHFIQLLAPAACFSFQQAFWGSRSKFNLCVLVSSKLMVLNKLEWVKIDSMKLKEVEDDKTVENSGFTKF